MSDLVERAKALAYRAHSGQVDKAGRPYIEHVARVADLVRNDRSCVNEDCNGYGEIIHSDSVGCSDPSCCSPATSPCPDCDVAEAVAWLHDVAEDCEVSFVNELVSEYPNEISAAVSHLSRSIFVETPRYYDVIRNSPLALRVKLADIADNSSEERLALLDEKTASRLRRKYAKAIAALTE